MKKIFNILATITSMSTVSTSIIACGTPNSENIKEQYKINEQGEIIYNFQEKQAYIIGFTINSHIWIKYLCKQYSFANNNLWPRNTILNIY